MTPKSNTMMPRKFSIEKKYREGKIKKKSEETEVNN